MYAGVPVVTYAPDRSDWPIVRWLRSRFLAARHDGNDDGEGSELLHQHLLSVDAVSASVPGVPQQKKARHLVMSGL